MKLRDIWKPRNLKPLTDLVKIVTKATQPIRRIARFFVTTCNNSNGFSINSTFFQQKFHLLTSSCQYRHFMNKSTYVAAKKIQQEYDISTAALRKWSQEGKIETIRAPGGKRLYKAQ